MPKSNKTRDDVFDNDSPTIESDASIGSFSENSVDFSPEESLSNDAFKGYTMLLVLDILNLSNSNIKTIQNDKEF